MYINLERPPTCNGFYGKLGNKGETEKYGQCHLLSRIYLNQFISDVNNDITPKKGMIFCQTLSDIMDVSDYLTRKLRSTLKNRGVENKNYPWVINHSEIGHVTAEHIRKRSSNGDISLYITTSVMLLGLDIRDIDVIIQFRPFPQMHSHNQAAGKIGPEID